MDLSVSKKNLWCLVFFGLFLRLITLGYPAITDPSEGRYAVMGQTMVLSGDWITPKTYIDDALVPFLGKPPLHTWVTAISYKLFGLSELAVRFPSFLACAGVLIVCALWSLELFGEASAIYTVLLLLSSWIFFFLGNSCLTDPLLMLFVTLSMFTFSRAFLRPAASAKSVTIAKHLFFVALGCGMMVKGPIAVAIPALALVLWAFTSKRIGEWKALPWRNGIIIFFLIVTPWYLLEEWANPGFLKYFFINENFLRFFVKQYGDKYGSGHIYIYGTIWLFLALGLLPGAFIFFSRAMRNSLRQLLSGRESSDVKLLLFWGIAPAMIFTFSRQISPSYVLPGIPAFSILFGGALASGLEKIEIAKLRYRTSVLLKCFWILSVILLLGGLILKARLFPVILSLPAIWLLFVSSRYLERSREARLTVSVAAGFFGLVVFYVLLVVNFSPFLDQKASSADRFEFARRKALELDHKVGFLSLVPYSAYFYSHLPGSEVAIERVSPEEAEKLPVDVLIAKNTEPPEAIQKLLPFYGKLAEMDGYSIYLRSALLPKTEEKK